ncbi:MAG: DnaJ domain-containing protein [Candidatus Margulisiibacteriota bacterium]
MISEIKYRRILNVSEDATIDEIKRATKELLKKCHPDKHHAHRGWAETQTKRVLEAYQVLVKDQIQGMKMIRKGVPSRPPVQVIYKEKKVNFIETTLPDTGGDAFLWLDVDIIHQVVHGSSVQWSKTLIVGMLGKQQYYFINPFITLRHAPFNPSDKIMLFKKDPASQRHLAYCFSTGGKLVECAEKTLNSTPVEICGQLELKGQGGRYYLGHQDLLVVDQLY